jgi:hypothetical protein
MSIRFMMRVPSTCGGAQRWRLAANALRARDPNKQQAL